MSETCRSIQNVYGGVCNGAVKLLERSCCQLGPLVPDGGAFFIAPTRTNKTEKYFDVDPGKAKINMSINSNKCIN